MIKSPQEQAFTFDLLGNEPGYVYIGLTDEGHEGDWRWVDAPPGRVHALGRRRAEEFRRSGALGRVESRQRKRVEQLRRKTLPRERIRMRMGAGQAAALLSAARRAAAGRLLAGPGGRILQRHRFPAAGGRPYRCQCRFRVGHVGPALRRSARSLCRSLAGLPQAAQAGRCAIVVRSCSGARVVLDGEVVNEALARRSPGAWFARRPLHPVITPSRLK